VVSSQKVCGPNQVAIKPLENRNDFETEPIFKHDSKQRIRKQFAEEEAKRSPGLWPHFPRKHQKAIAETRRAILGLASLPDRVAPECPGLVGFGGGAQVSIGLPEMEGRDRRFGVPETIARPNL
jgi:hypothetical protein